ncbi:hypothetical protein MA16_Dca024233 [Dendrobium catenatum]|uniref:Uncharacterized protein n=1 Tax=Dendrobium catenatum TaxID=906689 RepID=A0A2I0VHC8_9ASPA|nr:hypothetical protein MA16_Dca024233 [Dendrobium catenatum]
MASRRNFNRFSLFLLLALLILLSPTALSARKLLRSSETVMVVVKRHVSVQSSSPSSPTTAGDRLMDSVPSPGVGN